MAKKPYEPHPRLGMKVVPSANDYDRTASRQIIEEQLEAAKELGTESRIEDEFYDAKAMMAFAEDMYEMNIHPEMPEN